MCARWACLRGCNAHEWEHQLYDDDECPPPQTSTLDNVATRIKTEYSDALRALAREEDLTEKS